MTDDDDKKKKKRRDAARLLAVWKDVPGNQKCADCPQRGPRWASFLPPVEVVEGGNHKKEACVVLTCHKCAPLHHELGHKLKHVKQVDQWSEEELQALERTGNHICNDIYGGNESNNESDNNKSVDVDDFYEPAAIRETKARKKTMKDKYKKGTYFKPKQLLSRLGLTGKPKKHKAGKKAGETNIFGNCDFVTPATIVQDIQTVIDDPNITTVELEDFFVTSHKNDEIVLLLKEMLECDNRPWQKVTFVNDVLDGSLGFGAYAKHKRVFTKQLESVFQVRSIPYALKSRIILSCSDSDGDLGSGSMEFGSGGMTTDDMVGLLGQLEKDKSMINVNVTSQHVEYSLIRALTKLFQDERQWESVLLNLSSQSSSSLPPKKQQQLQAATEKMQKVAKASGIYLR